MHYSQFDTNLLRTLDVLLAERSVTRAAARLCVSQPAMSGSLQRLRDYFNDPLLIRSGRDMVLTTLAETLAGPVRETLLQIEATLTIRPAFDPAASRRAFRIAVSDYGQCVLIAPLLRRLAAEAPAMRCNIVPYCAQALDAVERGDLDMLINVESCETVSQHSTARDLKLRRLHADDFVCVLDPAAMPPQHSLTRASYQAAAHVLVKFGDHLETLVEQAWRREGLEMRVAATMPSFSSALLMLPGSGMVATAQRRLAARLAPALGLQVQECPVEIAPLRQILMWHPRSDHDPAHRFMRGLLADVAGDRDEAWVPALDWPALAARRMAGTAPPACPVQ